MEPLPGTRRRSSPPSTRWTSRATASLARTPGTMRPSVIRLFSDT